MYALLWGNEMGGARDGRVVVIRVVVCAGMWRDGEMAHCGLRKRRGGFGEGHVQVVL